MNHTLNYRIDLNNGNFGTNMEQAMQKTSQLDGMFSKLGGTLAAAFSIGKAKQIIDETTEVATKMQGLDNILKFSSKSQSDYASNQEFINKTIKDFALPAQEAKAGYANMMAAFKSMPDGGEKARQVFLGLSTAATVMHMSNEQVAMSTKALTDMMSKGTVQAEELKGQLGDAGIKDAMGVAARAMGKSIPELLDVMQKGQLMASEFVPKFAAQLSKEYGPGMAAAMNSFQAATNNANNAILEQNTIMGEKLMPAKIKLLELEAQGLSLLNASIDFYAQNNNAINALVGTYVTYKGVTLATAYAKKLHAMWTGVSTTSTIANTAATATNVTTTMASTGAYARNTIGFMANSAATVTSTIATEGATVAQWSLNAAMAANPIGLAITALGLLAVAFGIAADAAERLEERKKKALDDNIKMQGDLERGNLNYDAYILEKTGAVKKGQGLTKVVDQDGRIIRQNINELTNQKSTATGADRESLDFKLKQQKEKLEAVDEVAKEKLNKIWDDKAGKYVSSKNSISGASQSVSGATSSTSGHGANSGTGTGKSIVVNIQNLVKEIKVTSVSGINEREFEFHITNALIRAVRDFETTQ